MKRTMLVMVAGAALLVGCASDTPPKAGFGTETILLRESDGGYPSVTLRLHLVRAADACQLWVKANRVGVDKWYTFGEVDCAASLALFEDAR